MPIYLIVGGILLLTKISLNLLLFTAKRRSDADSLYKLIRRFDCSIFFLILWVIVGSVWVFEAGTKNHSCADENVIDYVTNNTRGGNVGMDIPEDSGAGGQMKDKESDCNDCPAGVYVFTVFLILLQYTALLILLVYCCTVQSKLRQRHQAFLRTHHHH